MDLQDLLLPRFSGPSRGSRRTSLTERETPREDPLAFCCQAMVCCRRLSAGRANRLARNGWRLKTSSSSSCWRHRFAAWLAMSRPQAHEPRQRPRSSWHRRSRRTTNGAIVSMVPSFGISVVGHRTPLARAHPVHPWVRFDRSITQFVADAVSCRTLVEYLLGTNSWLLETS